MKVAHIIMVHKNPSQLERLLKAMDHPAFYFYIHVDKKIDIAPYLYLKQFDRVQFITKRINCNWGGYSFVKGILSSLNEVLSLNIPYGFYNLMSAQDYPIKPVKIIADFYEKNLGKSFISYDPDDKREWWAHAIARYEQYHFTDLKFKGKYILQRLANFLLPKRKFPLAIKLYGSANSSWWSISEESAHYILQFISSQPKLEKFMKYTWTADEFLIASILMNSPHKDLVVNDNLRYITWSPNSPNPLIFNKNDTQAIISSSKLFARKFDIDFDTDILNYLDMHNSNISIKIS